MKKILSALWITTAFVVASEAKAKANTCPADAFIQSAGAAFMSASRAGSPGAFTSAASRFADLNSIAIFALGPYRADLPKGREGEYVNLTKKFMGQFMFQYASKFSGNSIVITSCNGNVIGAKLSTGQSLTFRLRGGGKRIEDVSVSGIWLAQTLRSKFVGVIRNNNGDVGALLSWLGN
ncbi:MAG: ABC transporter substrate-binding protein [Alphaproteobacteria bacterium]|nr:ABC transporter substrate-binding protein [Alphaproteobacteria bacterium]